jgi:lipid-binding SYLF domain-containing protein
MEVKIMKAHKYFFMAIAFGLVLTVSLNSDPLWASDKKEIEQKKSDIRKMAKETLSRLYKIQPSAKKAISKSAGYAVFSNFGMNDKKTKKQTFMKMVEIQAGLGLGAKKFRLVWVFENYKDVNEFINSGWELGGQTSAAAKLGDQGGAFAGAMSVSPGIWLYQLTDEGLALELTAKGTKYYKDDDLN